MAWSVATVGSADAIIADLEKQSAELEGDDKAEFDAVKAPISALLLKVADKKQVVRLSASGDGLYSQDGKLQGVRDLKLSLET